MEEKMKSAVALTYETLYELLRREKENAELQKLDPEFFAHVLGYMQEKQKLLDEAATQVDIFSVSERDKLLQQINNIRQLVKEIYDRRERKILEMALNKSRTNAAIIDTSNLLEEERHIYQAAVELLQGYRHGLLQNIFELKHPRIKLSAPAIHATKPALEATPKQVVAAIEGHGHHERRRITFLQRVERFVDRDLNTHGPFDPNAEAELPAYLASVLVAKGVATERLQ